MAIPSQDNTLNNLLKSHPSVWRGRDQYRDHASVPTGFNNLNSALPSQGWGIGSVTELLVTRAGIGEFSLLLPALQKLTSDGQWAAFVNPPHVPYAPALSNAGINLERLLIINAGDDKNTLWATEQLLRAKLFGSVIAWVNRSNAQKQRRLQLAAEVGETWATVFRPASAQTEHSPAACRILVDVVNDHLSLNIFKSRGTHQQTVLIEPSEFDRSQGVEWPVPAGVTAIKPLKGA